MTFGSLFAGIGGMDLGLERAGLVCKWQVEIDEYATRVLGKHWPNVRRWADVRTFPPSDPGEWRVDCIAGGFPCQDVSVAGHGAGLDGDRSGLWYEFARTIGILRPRFVIVENVPGLLVRGIDVVLGKLAAFGFDSEWSVVSACAMGAPHTRERLFIVSYPNGMFRSEGMGLNGHEFKGIQSRNARQVQSDWLATVSANSGSANGIPDWSHRCRTLGNSIVPQVIEWIGLRLMEASGASSM